MLPSDKCRGLKRQQQEMLTVRSRNKKYLFILLIACGVIISVICIAFNRFNVTTHPVHSTRNVLAVSRLTDPDDLDQQFNRYNTGSTLEPVQVRTFNIPSNATVSCYKKEISGDDSKGMVVYKAIDSDHFKAGKLIPELSNQHCDDSQTFCIPWMFSNVTRTADQAISHRKEWINANTASGSKHKLSVVMRINLGLYNQYAQQHAQTELAIGQLVNETHIIVKNEPIRNEACRDHHPLNISELQTKAAKDFYVPLSEEVSFFEHFTFNNSQIINHQFMTGKGQNIEYKWRDMYDINDNAGSKPGDTQCKCSGVPRKELCNGFAVKIFCQ